MQDLLEWWNAIYLVPLGLALLWILVSALCSELDFEAADSSSTSDPDFADGHPGEFWSVRWRDAVGLNRVSATLVVGLFMLVWGALGLIVNRVSLHVGLSPGVFIVPSLALTLVTSVMVTRVVVELIYRFLPATETFAINTSDLIGRTGSVVYEITERTGTVQITDQYGTVHRRMARTEVGASSAAANTSILVVGHDQETGRLIVRKTLS